MPSPSGPLPMVGLRNKDASRWRGRQSWLGAGSLRRRHGDRGILRGLRRAAIKRGLVELMRTSQDRWPPAEATTGLGEGCTALANG